VSLGLSIMGLPVDLSSHCIFIHECIQGKH
jgi:hypothetical protein